MPALTVSQQARAETKIPAIRVAVHQIAFGAWPILTWEKQIWHIEFGACNKGGHFPPALLSGAKRYVRVAHYSISASLRAVLPHATSRGITPAETSAGSHLFRSAAQLPVSAVHCAPHRQSCAQPLSQLGAQSVHRHK